MDYLKELAGKLGGKIDRQQLYDANFKVPSFREFTIKDYRGYKIRIDEFEDLFAIRIKIDSDFTISINNSDKISAINNLITAEETEYNVYIWKISYSEFIIGHLYNPFLSEHFRVFWRDFISKINKLNLTKSETVGIRVDCINLALIRTRQLIPIIEDIIELIDKYPTIFSKNSKKKIFKKNIPQNLQPLIPLLKKWSIPDDGEREQLMEETSEKQKKKLVKTVWPYMIEINQFLDSFGDEALSHEAILLGNLAELISELSIAY